MKSLINLCLVAVLTLAGMTLVAPAASASTAGLGDFNDAFGGDGISIYNRSALAAPTKDSGQAVAVAPDGRVLVVGETTDNGDAFSTFLILRYLPTGGLDRTFSGDGALQVGFGTQFARASGVALDSQGRILVSGTAANVQDYEDQSARFAITRILANGVVDTTFGVNGRTTTTFGAGGAEAMGIAIAANDKPVVAGYVQDVGGSHLTGIATARYTAAGALDPTYSSDHDGKTVNVYANTSAVGTGIAISWDFRIFISVYVTLGGANYGGVLKLTTNGIPDATFVSAGGPDGFILYNFPGNGDYASAIAIQNGGRGRVLLAALSAGAGVISQIAGINQSTGARDNSFGTNGYSSSLSIGVASLAVTSTDSIVAAGELAGKQTVAMLKSDGTLDDEFGSHGYSDPTGLGTTTARAVAINSHDIIYTAGIDTTVRSSALITSLYGRKQAVPAQPFITSLVRRGPRIVVAFQPTPGVGATSFRYRVRYLRPNGVPLAFGAWQVTAAQQVVVPTSRPNPGFDFEVAGVGQFGPGASATTRWFAIDHGRRSRCQPFTVQRINYAANRRAVVVFLRRAKRCAVWRTTVGGRFQPLPARSVRLITPVLTANRYSALIVRRAPAVTVVSLRPQ